jgi:hypothetical protein
MTHDLEIRPAHQPGAWIVAVDGLNIARHIRALRIDWDARNGWTCHLQLHVSTVATTVRKDIHVTIEPDLATALRQLGWTPPGDDLTPPGA